MKKHPDYDIYVTRDGKVYRELPQAGRGHDQYYPCVTIPSSGGKKVDVHRLVAQTYIDNPGNYPCVLHRDEEEVINNTVTNLWWGTYKENMQDMVRKGRGRRPHKLMSDRDTEIIELFLGGVKCKDIAEKFGLHGSRISQIIIKYKKLKVQVSV